MSFVIGVTGRVGSGKSQFQQVYEAMQLGPVLDCDVIGHLGLQDEAVKAGLVTHFGNNILKAGEIDRPSLAALAFASPAQTQVLNQWVHPYIAKSVNTWLVRYKREGKALVLLAGALLQELHLDALCNDLVVIDAEDALIQAHIGEKFKRAQFQQSRQAFLDMATVVIENKFDASFDTQCRDYLTNVSKKIKK